jgi:C_GCAxxG_C_C family probable redox protein
MYTSQVEEQAFQYFQSGFHCAEAISMAITEAFADISNSDLPKVASAFCGGVADTKEELCGALSGGIIAIGYLTGRMQPGKDIQLTKELAAALRTQFIAHYGVTKCQAVLDTLGPQENALKCKELTARVAGMLAQLLRAKGFQEREQGVVS